MNSAWKRKLAAKVVLSPQMNRILLQSKKSWDEVAGILKGGKKKA